MLPSFKIILGKDLILFKDLVVTTNSNEITSINNNDDNPTELLMQILSNILQVPVLTLKDGDFEWIGVIEMVGKKSSFFSKKVKSLKKVNRQYIPSLDPITSLVLYNQWKEDYQKIE